MLCIHKPKPCIETRWRREWGFEENSCSLYLHIRRPHIDGPRCSPAGITVKQAGKTWSRCRECCRQPAKTGRRAQARGRRVSCWRSLLSRLQPRRINTACSLAVKNKQYAWMALRWLVCGVADTEERPKAEVGIDTVRTRPFSIDQYFCPACAQSHALSACIHISQNETLLLFILDDSSYSCWSLSNEESVRTDAVTLYSMLIWAPSISISEERMSLPILGSAMPQAYLEETRPGFPPGYEPLARLSLSQATLVGNLWSPGQWHSFILYMHAQWANADFFFATSIHAESSSVICASWACLPFEMSSLLPQWTERFHGLDQHIPVDHPYVGHLLHRCPSSARVSISRVKANRPSQHANAPASCCDFWCTCYCHVTPDSR